MYCTPDFSAVQLALLHPAKNQYRFYWEKRREEKRIFPGITENLPSHTYGSKKHKARALIDSYVSNR